MLVTFASVADEGNVLIAVYLFICLYVCLQNNSKTTQPNFMKFCGMIGHNPRTNRLDFGSDRVKGQGHEKVKNDFSQYIGQILYERDETNAKM